MDNEHKIAENKARLTWLGSEWGGLNIDLDLVPEKSRIISCGLDKDISFDVELIQRKACHIVGVDPTKRAAKTVRKLRAENRNDGRHFELLRKAIHGKSGLQIRMGGPASSIIASDGLTASTISLEDLVLTYSGAALLKLDVETAEFIALETLTTRLRIPQVAIAFHIWFNTETDQHPTDGLPPHYYTSEDVREAITKMRGMGYKFVYEERRHAEWIGQETLFIRNQYADQYHEIELMP